MRLVLLRHGQTPSNVAGALDTARPGAGLTELGERQAAAVPAALAGLLDAPVVALHASPLVRTQLTAAPLAGVLGLDVAVTEGFEEVSAGEVEMRSDEEAVQAYVDCLRGWMHGDLARSLPGGESGEAFLSRFDAAVRAVVTGVAEHEAVVVVSHGAAIRCWSAWACAMAPDDAADLHISNTAAAVLDGDPDTGWTLVRWTGDPLGGAALLDTHAHDVTGDDVDEDD